MGAVVLVLLVACANLGNLLLARSVARRREMAVRQALGAQGARIVRQLLTESLVLALIGGAAGVGVGVGFLRMVLAQRSVDLPRIQEISLDGTALLFTLVIAIASGIAFGLVPAVQLSRRRNSDAMREGARGSAGHGWIRNLLVVSEFALATMLLCGAGLLLHSFARLIRVNPGIETEHLLTFSVRAPQGDSTFVERSLERIRAIPGVSAASAGTSVPLGGRGNGAWINIVRRPLAPNANQPATAYRVVTPEFFSTAGIPLRRGSLFTGAERADHAPAVVINEALAKRFWPGEDPIGEEIWLGAPGNPLTPHSPIVGIVGDTRDVGLGAEPVPTVYVPYGMTPGWRLSGYVVRSAGEPGALAAAVRREIRAMDASLPIRRLGPMNDLLSDSVAPARWSLTLLGTFAGVALALAAIGIFGVLSFVVTQRMRELGIRVALGASPARLRRMVVTQSLGLVLVGAAIGLAGALAMSRFMQQLLFGVSPMDPPTYVAATAVLIGVALVASYAPARRATRADPIVALRSE
jgi:putative ABC transport system permease protein